MPRYRIAVLPGDGIGPEVMSVALRVLRGAGGPSLDFTPHEFGAAHYRRTGDPFPQVVIA
jgi:3-isopropylmalate dehydrogenase